MFIISHNKHVECAQVFLRTRNTPKVTDSTIDTSKYNIKKS
jgi:hypothetical protein